MLNEIIVCMISGNIHVNSVAETQKKVYFTDPVFACGLWIVLVLPSSLHLSPVIHNPHVKTGSVKYTFFYVSAIELYTDRIHTRDWPPCWISPAAKFDSITPHNILLRHQDDIFYNFLDLNGKNDQKGEFCRNFYVLTQQFLCKF